MSAPRDFVRPAEIVAYLRGRGWSVADDGYEGGALWEKQSESGPVEAFVPMAEGAPDYGPLVQRLVHELARWEHREPLFVLREMKESIADVIRFRVVLDGSESSRLPLSVAPRVFKTAHDVTISAANAASRRRSHYRNWTREVHEFAQQAEVGQTEPGSYVVRVLCPLTHLPQPQLQPSNPQPFARRVTSTLSTALGASSRAARSAITNGDLGVFDETVGSGVSSNLCSALAGVRDGAVTLALEIQLSWAQLRDRVAPPRGTFFFGPDTLEVLQSAARHLRDQEEEVFEDQVFYGYVTECRRGATDDSGTITLEGWIDDPDHREPFACRVELMGEVYVNATRAHGDRDFVQIRGTLLRQGRRWSMSQVDAFTTKRELDRDEG